MGTRFAFDFEKCTECRRCMAACSLVKTGLVRMADSRIDIARHWPELPDIRVCRFDDCAGHPCVASCPVEAISEHGTAWCRSTGRPARAARPAWTPARTTPSA